LTVAGRWKQLHYVPGDQEESAMENLASQVKVREAKAAEEAENDKEECHQNRLY
jgi:hypothetical protein